ELAGGAGATVSFRIVSDWPPVGVAATLPSGCAARSAGAKVADHVPPDSAPGAVAPPSVAVSAVASAATGPDTVMGWAALATLIVGTPATRWPASTAVAAVALNGAVQPLPGPGAPPPLLTAVVPPSAPLKMMRAPPTVTGGTAVGGATAGNVAVQDPSGATVGVAVMSGKLPKITAVRPPAGSGA